MKKNPDTTTILLVAAMAAAGLYFYMQSQQAGGAKEKVIQAAQAAGYKVDAQGNVLNQANQVIATVATAEKLAKAIGNDITSLAKLFSQAKPAYPSGSGYVEDPSLKVPAAQMGDTVAYTDTGMKDSQGNEIYLNSNTGDTFTINAEGDMAPVVDGMISRYHGLRGLSGIAEDAANLPRPYGYASYDTVHSLVRGMYDDNEGGFLSGRI